MKSVEGWVLQTGISLSEREYSKDIAAYMSLLLVEINAYMLQIKFKVSKNR